MEPAQHDPTRVPPGARASRRRLTNSKTITAVLVARLLGVTFFFFFSKFPLLCKNARERILPAGDAISLIFLLLRKRLATPVLVCLSGLQFHKTTGSCRNTLVRTFLGGLQPQKRDGDGDKTTVSHAGGTITHPPEVT